MKIPPIETIVTYATPPLNEVAIAIQFQPIGLTLDRIIRLRAAFEGKFPFVEEKPPLPPKFELYDDLITVAEINVQLLEGLPDRRFWFISEDQENIVQIQPDRFIRNWRKRQSDGSYPRAENIVPAFAEDFKKFVDVLDETSQDIEANQIEVSYFNNFAVPTGESYLEAAYRYLNVFDGGLRTSPELPSEVKADAARMSLTYIFEDSEKRGKGRLHVDLIPALDADRARILRLQFVARGRPAKMSEDSVVEFVLLARRNIVQMFEAITSEPAKAAWGRQG